MRKRGWKVQHLCEFYPNNPNLLGKKETNIAFERLYAHAQCIGLNINHGFKINIRLRPHYDDTVFLDYNDLLGTMLHEQVDLKEINDKTNEIQTCAYRYEGHDKQVRCIK